MKKIVSLFMLLTFLTGCTLPSEFGFVEEPEPTSQPLSFPTPAVSPSAPARLSILPPDSAKVEISQPLGKGTISGLAWSPDGTRIAISGSTGIRLYSAETLEEIRFMPTDFLITSVAFSPDGRMLATGSADLAFSSRNNWRRSSPWRSKNNFVQLWEVESGNLLVSLKAGFSYVTSVVFSSDGTLLASGSMYPDDDAVRIWKLDSISGGALSPWQVH